VHAAACTGQADPAPFWAAGTSESADERKSPGGTT
jgi:hypothetical protein